MIIKSVEYYTAKREAHYNINLGTFYKYMFMCLEKEKLNVIFFYSNSKKVIPFQLMAKEKAFIDLFEEHIKQMRMSENDFEIVFNNGSKIKFLKAGNGTRGHKTHYAVVDTDIDLNTYYDTILPTIIPHDIHKDKLSLIDNYTVDFMEMRRSYE